VIAALVSRLLIGMAGGAGNLGWRVLVRRGLHVGVAVDAGEHAAVDGSLESVGIQRDADRLAANILGHGGIAVARQTFLVGGLWGIDFLSGRECSPREYQTQESKLQDVQRGACAQTLVSCRHSGCLLANRQAMARLLLAGNGRRGSESSHGRT